MCLYTKCVSVYVCVYDKTSRSNISDVFHHLPNLSTYRKGSLVVENLNYLS